MSDGHAEFLGIQLYDGNPFAKGNHFADFVNDAYKMAGAISFRKPHAGVSINHSFLWSPDQLPNLQILPTAFLEF